MKLIETTKELNAFCKKIKKSSHIAIDTEFLREKTYYPKLCLIQICAGDHMAAVDPLAKDMDLSSFADLLQNDKITKVLHGCRQDLEIFLYLFGKLPENIFDTQVAAMVCGFGDSISYEGLVSHYTNGVIDKSQRFTDWSLRPLNDKQIDYAMADVTHLDQIYPMITEEIKKTKRENWFKEEMDLLYDPSIFHTKPEEAWNKIKTRLFKPKHLVVLKYVAAWREALAQTKDIPKGRILKDKTLIEIATSTPKNLKALGKIRGVHNGFLNSSQAPVLLDAIQTAVNSPKEEWPDKIEKFNYPSYIKPTVELLKVLLKLKTEEENVAPKLIINGEEIKRLAYEEKPDIPCLSGWRYDVFGRDALSLKEGKIAFTLGKKGHIEMIRL